MKFSPEHRANISASHLGKKLPPEARAKIGDYWRGRKRAPFTDEHRERLRAAKLGTKRHPAAIAKTAAANRGTKRTVETREKMSAARRGPLGAGWRGGITPINNTIRMSLEYREWRKSVFERDNYTCQHCGTKRGPFNADHILPFATHIHLRFELTNGRTLCVPCHEKTPTYGGKTRVAAA